MTPTAGKVVEIVQEALGHNVTCMNTARRHQKVIRELLALEIAPEQKAILHGKKHTLEAKWGDLQQPPGTPLKIKAMSPAVWLGKRRFRERDFYSLKYAAEDLLGGETSLTRIMVHALAKATHVMSGPVRIDTFRLWLLRTGTARHVAVGKYGPGPNAQRLSKMHWPDMLTEIEGG